MSVPGPAETPKSGARREAAWRLRRLLLVSSLYAFGAISLFRAFYQAFLRSLVRCPLPQPEDNGACPVGSTPLGDGCAAEPPQAPTWSYSGTCAVKSVVINSAKELDGQLGMIENLGFVLCMVFLGPLADTWGRKQVMLVSLGGSALRNVLFLAAALDAVRHGGAHAEALLTLGTISFSCLHSYELGMKAMATDLSPPDMGARSATFAVLAVALELTVVLGSAFGFSVLSQHLTDYSTVWTAFVVFDLCLLALAACILRPTQPAPEEQEEAASGVSEDAHEADSESSGSEDAKSSSAGNCVSRALCEVVAIARVVAADQMLLRLLALLVAQAVGMPALGMASLFSVTYLGYSQETASLLGVGLPLLAAAGSLAASRLAATCGSFQALQVALVANTAGMLLMGLSGLATASRLAAQALFWAGALLAGMSRGLALPTFPAILSVLVSSHMQGRLFAFVHICETAGMSVGVKLFNQYLFDATWSGWMSGLCFWTAAAISFVGIFWLGAIRPRTGEESAEE